MLSFVSCNLKLCNIRWFNLSYSTHVAVVLLNTRGSGRTQHTWQWSCSTHVAVVVLYTCDSGRTLHTWQWSYLTHMTVVMLYTCGSGRSLHTWQWSYFTHVAVAICDQPLVFNLDSLSLVWCSGHFRWFCVLGTASNDIAMHILESRFVYSLTKTSIE